MVVREKEPSSTPTSVAAGQPLTAALSLSCLEPMHEPGSLENKESCRCESVFLGAGRREERSTAWDD